MAIFLAARSDVKMCGSLRVNDEAKFMQAYGEINASN
jgi:hypothetical protein